MTGSPGDETILPLAFDRVGYRAAGTVLLDDVTFRLQSGTRSVILGPNGSGKSLSLRLAHGLLQPTSGKIAWSCDDARACALRQAMVFETPILLRRSARANVEYALSLHGVPRSERRVRAAEFLERTGLSSLAERRARVLSAGERQRLALARAWATAPEVLFLDEPTAALDPRATRAVEELILSIAQAGTKIVMTTHDLSQARRIAEDVLFFCEGRLLESGRADRFFETPESDEAQAFLRGDLSW